MVGLRTVEACVYQRSQPNWPVEYFIVTFLDYMYSSYGDAEGNCIPAFDEVNDQDHH